MYNLCFIYNFEKKMFIVFLCFIIILQFNKF